MKKHTTLLLSLVLVVITSIESFSQAQIAIGVKAGANISKFDESTADNFTSFVGGAFALIKIAKIGIQPEVLFSQQGAKFSTGTLKTGYMNVPVMVKFYIVKGFNIQAGPQFGFLTAAKFDGNDVKNSLKSSDITGNFGLGLDLPFGLTVDARYNLGLSDINDVSGGTSLKSRVVQLTVGYKIFKFGK